MKSLIAKLEKAPEGSRELDRSIHEWLMDPEQVAPFSSRWDAIPHYTTSLDAARTLVPEEWMVASISEFIRSGGKGSGVMLIRTADAEKELAEIANPWDALHRTEAATPALALTAASLKARA